MQVSIKVSDYVPDRSENLEVDFRLLIASLVNLVNDSDLEIVNGLVSRKKLELGKDSLSFRGPVVWTCLDKNTRECENTDEFKRGVKISINKTALYLRNNASEGSIHLQGALSRLTLNDHSYCHPRTIFSEGTSSSSESPQRYSGSIQVLC